MQMEQLSIGGAISFQLSLVRANTSSLQDGLCVLCEILVHACKGNVQYRYSVATGCSDSSLVWENAESYQIPLEPTPSLIEFLCFKACPKTSSKLQLLGKKSFPNSFIQSFDSGNGKKTFLLDAIEEDNNEIHQNYKDLSLTCKIEFDIDKTKLAHYLFNTFPEEILLNIFLFVDYQSLKNISLVCHQWHRLTKDHRLLYIMGKRAYRGADFHSARQLYLCAADNGDDCSMDELGRMFQHGNGSDKDYDLAFQWYTRAAKQGNASGMNDLGWCYEKGLGCEPNAKKAAKWYLRSAEAGNISGENNIGWCYQKGLGTPVDYRSAVKWYRIASEHGNSSGYNNLAWCYHQGLGVPQDYKQAMKTYKKAARLGNKYAQNTIGNMYFHGQGVTKDYARAIKWFEKAAAQGHEAAKGRLEALREELAELNAANGGERDCTNK